MINIQELRAKNEVERVKILMNLRVVDMKVILKNENTKRVYKMKKNELQNEILQLVYLEQLEFNIEPEAAAPEEPEVIEIDEVLPAIIEEQQQELINDIEFKEIMNYILNDDLVGLTTNGKITKFNVELVLNCLNSEETFGDIFGIDSSDGHYNAAAYNELLCKMMDMNNEVLTNIANYGFEYLTKAIEGFKNHDSNNPPF